MLGFAPFLVLYFWLACDGFDCSVTAPVEYAMTHSFSKLVVDHFPKPSVYGFQLYFGWLSFQALLYTFLPAAIGYGEL